MIIAAYCWIFCSKNCENRLVNKVFMIGCMTCPWVPTAGGTTAQSGQRNDGVTAPKTQRLHQRLGRINRTLHADIEITYINRKKNINNLHKINLFLWEKWNFVEKFAFNCWHNTVLWYATQQTIHNTKYIVVI